MSLKQYARYDSGLGKYRNRLNYYKNLQRQLDAHTTKHASIHFRKNALDRQTVSNYQNEYNRIRGELSSTVLPDALTRARLKERQAKLVELGATAVNSIV